MATVKEVDFGGMRGNALWSDLSAEQMEAAITRAVPGGELDGALSNKATIHTSFAAIGLTESTATLDRIAAALDDGAELFIAIGTIGASTGLVPATYGLLTVKKYSPNYAECDYRRLGGPRWYGYYNAGQTGTNQWTGWIPLATATPPAWYNLPLGDGATASTTPVYGKSSAGIGWMRGSFTLAQVPVANQLIGVIPPGWRTTVLWPVTFTQGRGWTSYGWITTTGEVKFWGGASSPNGFEPINAITFSAVFPVA